MLYGCELRIYGKEQSRRIEAFEMWCFIYRKIQKMRPIVSYQSPDMSIGEKTVVE